MLLGNSGCKGITGHTTIIWHQAQVSANAEKGHVQLSAAATDRVAQQAWLLLMHLLPKNANANAIAAGRVAP
jgi:hypothetical protein